MYIDIDKVYNEDGTEYSPPKDEEYIKILKEFPECEMGHSYSCIFCAKCPYGSYFKWPEKYKDIVDRHIKLIENYTNNHNSNGIYSLIFSLKSYN